MSFQQLNKKDKINVIILMVIALALVLATVLLFPLFARLSNEENRQALTAYIRGKGFLGVGILLGLQLLQVVVAIIPGEVVEVIAGILYGTFGGYIICTVGVLLSSILVFYSVRKLGAGFVERMVSKEKMKKLQFLRNNQRLEMLIFLLFFIPGTPKDLLTYFVPLTEVKPLRFFLISTVARIPSILSSTYAGATIDQGRIGMTIVIFVLTGVLGLVGIIVNNKLVTKMNGKHKE